MKGTVQHWSFHLVIALIVMVLLITSLSVPTYASTNGQTITPGGSGDATDTGTVGATGPTDPLINYTGDGWEVMIWINGAHKGSIIVYGNNMINSMGGAPPTTWGPSNGVKSSGNTSGAGLDKTYNSPGFWTWPMAGTMMQEQVGSNAVMDKIIKPLQNRGVLDGGEVAQLTAQMTMTPEQMAESCIAGTFLHIAISAEPQGIIRPGAGNSNLEWHRRTSYWTRFAGTNRQYIADRFSDPFLTKDVGTAELGLCPRGKVATSVNWVKDPVWSPRPQSSNGTPNRQDNYVVWWNWCGDEEPDPPDTSITTTPPAAGLEEIRIYAWELLAGIHTTFDINELSNQYGPNGSEGGAGPINQGYIAIIEEADCLIGTRIHDERCCPSL